jgi:hypothetical protein
LNLVPSKRKVPVEQQRRRHRKSRSLKGILLTGKEEEEEVAIALIQMDLPLSIFLKWSRLSSSDRRANNNPPSNGIEEEWKRIKEYKAQIKSNK